VSEPRTDVESPPDFGQQTMGYEDPHPWALPVIGALAFLAFCLMLLTGTAPWQ
jgi:hypothetical protein